MTKVALLGAGGKMGVRLATNLSRTDFDVAHVEVSEAGQKRLKAETCLDCIPQEEALRGAEVVILADRGFGDQKLFAFLGELGFGYVIRFRGNIRVAAEDGETKPAAGVIATRPATPPVAAPIPVALPWRRRSGASHPIMPPTAPRCVARNADDARPSAATADPALKPNHPNHRMPAPSTTIGTLCGVNPPPPGSRRRPT